MTKTLVILGILALVVGVVLLVDWDNKEEVALQEELNRRYDEAQEAATEQGEALRQAADAQSEALTLLVLYLWSVQVDLGTLVGLAPEDICMPSLPLEDDYFLRVIEAVALAVGQEPPMMTREFLVALAEQEEGAWERYCGISAAIRDTREEADDGP